MTDNNNRENEQYTQPQNVNPETEVQSQSYTPNAETQGQSYDNIYSSAPSEQMGNTSESNSPETYNSVESNAYSESYSSTYPNVYPQNQPYAGQQTNNIYGDQYSQSPSNIYNPYVQPMNTVPETVSSENPKKNKKILKRTVVIVACLALVACIGIGGGFLGSMLANNSGTIAVNGESSTTSSDNKDGESSKSSLTINKTEGTEVAATTTQEVAEKAAESVVEITTETVVTSQFMQQYVSQGAGSGVIISEDGYIITNNHVIDGANNITVKLKNGKSYDAKLIGKDSQLDVALLKIEEKDLKPVTFGESKNLKVGETAIAIGNPLGSLGGTVTNGIISALDREITIDGETMNLLQTNAAINPGNSGGGLFNANAELIGLVVAKSSGESIEGLGFAIPIDNVVDILDDLMDNGYVTGRASLGVSLQDISSDELFSYRLDKAGTYIAQITSGSAAEKAGLKVGDCITKIDDTEITSASGAASIISKHKAGDKITITVYRDGETKSMSVTLDEEKPNETSTETSRNSKKQYGY